MKNDIFIRLFILIIFCAACQNKKNINNTVTDKEHYPDGSIKLAVHKKGGDTVIADKYYPDGNLQEEAFIFNSSEPNSLFNGFYIHYFSNGNIEKVNASKKGKPFGNEILYYQNKSIKEYSFTSYAEETLFIRDYDSLGNIISEKGEPIAASYNKNDLQINDTIRCYHIIGLLANWDIKLLMTDVSNGQTNDTIITINNQTELDNEYYGKSLMVRSICRSKGVRKWKTQVKIIDKEYNREINYADTLIFTVR